MSGRPPARDDPWRHLARYTDARIALGRAGVSLPTAANLAFAAAHASARDAIHVALPVADLAEALAARGLATCTVRSAAADRTQYLLRPDLGRRLDAGAQATLAAMPACAREALCVVVADGLSALAIERHAVPLIDALRAELGAAGIATPIVIAQLARVALGDAIASCLRAHRVAVIIGERPGLSAADSAGIYFTHAPAPGTVDARLNCISNIRDGGLDYASAAARLHQLMRAAAAAGTSGVAITEDAIDAVVAGGQDGNFLLAPPR
jgi:ethanolamine ammonia-lyase small subunit